MEIARQRLVRDRRKADIDESNLQNRSRRYFLFLFTIHYVKKKTLGTSNESEDNSSSEDNTGPAADHEGSPELFDGT